MNKNDNHIIAPSLLAADFSNLKNELKLCNDSKAEWLHLDIMDQQFVPNLSFGPAVVKSVRPHSNLYRRRCRCYFFSYRNNRAEIYIPS